jgi:hypothetical protein
VKLTTFSSCDKTPYVIKPVSESILEHLQEFRAQFESHSRLRIHIDKIKGESILVYEYFKTDLLALVENYPPLPRKSSLGRHGLRLKLKGEKLLNYKIGNVMWRSPEGQLGRGVGKPSEVFSFALLVSLMLD